MNLYGKEKLVAISIARKAGKIMLQYFDGDQKVKKKKDGSVVTIADKLINSLVIKELKKAFPQDDVIGEEESAGKFGLGRKWFCDPIDGTAAYVWGIPTSMFSLALVVNGEPVLGITYDPYLNLLYTGVKGGKSYCNKKVVKVSNKNLKNGIYAVTGSAKAIPRLNHIKAMIKEKVLFASFSGAVYKCMLIAKGRLVGYIEDGLNPHDIAASQVIIEGAGGIVTALDGKRLDYSKKFKGSIVSNGVIHKELLEYTKLDK